MTRRRSRRARGGLLLAALLAATGLTCDDGPPTLAPGLGDFVQAVTPADGAVLSANKFGEGAVAVLLNFFPSEGRVRFGSLSSFRFDGEEVAESVAIFDQSASSGTTTLTYERSEIEQGGHDVEVEYVDSEGIVHRFGWSFTIRD